MTVNALEAKAHELLSHLGPGKLAAVVHLLEAITDRPEEPVTDEDRHRFHESQAFFASGKGIPMEDVLAEFGMKPQDFPLSK